MAVPKYLNISAGGVVTEDIASITQVADKIVATDSSGRIALEQMPVGVGPENIVLPSFEDLVAGDFVNIFDDTGTIKVQKANATDALQEAHGFVIEAVTAPADATVYVDGQNDAVTGLTPGVDYFLAATDGAVTNTAPTATGNLVQRVGRTTAAGNLIFKPQVMAIRA